jgi:hypothetical protein
MTRYQLSIGLAFQWILLTSLLLLSNGCDFSQGRPSETSVEGSSNNQSPKDQTEKTSSGKSLQINQVNLEKPEHLIKRFHEATASEKEAAKHYHKVGLEASNDKDWGAAAKAYAEEAIRMPTPENLIRLADADVMSRSSQPNKSETLKVKLRSFQRAVRYYQSAVDLSKASGIPLSSTQKEEISQKTKCLNTFISKPDPKTSPCQLVTDALKISQIN